MNRRGWATLRRMGSLAIVMVVALAVGYLLFRAKQQSEAWVALSEEEMAALRVEIQGMAPTTIDVWCDDERCRALADSFQDVFTNLGWTVRAERNYGLYPVPLGITVIPRSWYNGTAVAVADAINSATNGRLKPGTQIGVPDETLGLLIGERPN